MQIFFPIRPHKIWHKIWILMTLLLFSLLYKALTIFDRPHKKKLFIFMSFFVCHSVYTSTGIVWSWLIPFWQFVNWHLNFLELSATIFKIDFFSLTFVRLFWIFIGLSLLLLKLILLLFFEMVLFMDILAASNGVR